MIGSFWCLALPYKSLLVPLLFSAPRKSLGVRTVAVEIGIYPGFPLHPRNCSDSFFFVLFLQDTWKIDPAQEYRAAYHDEQAHLCGYSPESLLNGFREGMLGIIFLVCRILILV